MNISLTVNQALCPGRDHREQHNSLRAPESSVSLPQDNLNASSQEDVITVYILAGMFIAPWISTNSPHLLPLCRLCVTTWPVLENGLWGMRNVFAVGTAFRAPVQHLAAWLLWCHILQAAPSTGTELDPWARRQIPGRVPPTHFNSQGSGLCIQKHLFPCAQHSHHRGCSLMEEHHTCIPDHASLTRLMGMWGWGWGSFIKSGWLRASIII